MSIEAIVAIASAASAGLTTFVGLVIWLTKLDSRVGIVKNALDAEKVLIDQKQVALKELIEARFDSTDMRLLRIERALNGTLYAEH